MAGNLGHVAINLALNSGGFDKGIKEVNAQLGNFNKAVRSTSGVLKEVPDDLQAMLKQTKNLDNQSKLLTEKFKLQEKQLESLQDVVNETTNNGEDMTKMTEAQRKELTRLGTEISKTEDDLKKNAIQQDKLKDNIEKTTKALKDESGALSDKNGKLNDTNGDMQKAVNNQDSLTDAVKRSEKALKDEADAYKLRKEKADAKLNLADNVSTGLNNVGNGALAISGAAIGAGMVAVNKAMEVEDANTNIYRVADIPIEEREAFAKDLLEKFADSTFESYSEMASIFEGLGAAGLTSANELEEGYEAIKNLSVASEQSTDSVTQLLTSAAGLLQFQEGEMTKYASALAAGGNAGSSTDAEVQTMASQLAGLTVQGVSNPNIVSLASFWSSAGINPEAARSGSTSIFNQLKNADNSDSDGDGKTLATVSGLSNDQYDEMRKNDPTELFERFVVGLKGINDAGGDVSNTLAALGFDSSIENDILMKSAAQASMFEEVQVAVLDAYNSGTVAQTEAATAAETASKKMQQALNELNTKFIVIGSELLPLFVEFLNAAQPAIDLLGDFAEWFSELDDTQKKFYVNLVLGIGAFGLLSKGLAGIISMGTGLTRFFGGTSVFLKTIFTNSKDVSGAVKVLGSNVDDLALSMNGGLIATSSFNSAISTSTTNAGLLTGAFSGLSGALLTLGGLGSLTLGVSFILGKLEESYDYLKSDLKGYLDNLGTVLQKEVVNQRGITLETNTKVQSSYVNTIDEESVKGVKSALEKEAESFDELINNAKANNTYNATGVESIDARLEEGRLIREGEINQALTDYEYLNTEIVRINEQAASENRGLYLDEINYLDEIADKKNVAKSQTLTKDSLDQQNALKAMNSELNTKDSNKALNEQVKTIPDLIKKLKDERDNTLTQIEEAHLKDPSDVEGYAQAVKTTTDAYNKKIQDSAIDYYEALRADNGVFNAFDDDAKNEKVMAQEASGLTSEEFNLLKGKSDLLKKATLDTSLISDETTRVAAETWNSFFNELSNDDFTDGDPLANIRDYLNGENGVEGIRGILNSGSMTDEMKEMLAEAAIEAGKWNDLTFEEKKLIINDDALTGIQSAVESSGLWEKMSINDRLGLVNSDEDTAKLIALQNDAFKELNLDAKSEILQKPITEAEDAFMTANNLWNNEEFMTKFMEIDTSSVESAYYQFDKLKNEFENGDINPLPISVDTSNFRLGTEIAMKSWNELNALDKTASFFLTAKDLNDGGIEQFVNNYKTIITGFKDWFFIMSGRISTIKDDLLNNLVSVPSKIKEWFGGLFEAGANTISTNSQYGVPVRKYATGTGYHTGGLAVLGDGGKNEPYLTPSGSFGISPSNDTLFNLPRGSQVWSSLDKFISDLPHFADGTSQSFLNSTSLSNVVGGSSNTVNLIVNMAPNSTFTDDNKKDLVNIITRELNRNNSQLNRARGGR